jgi:pimeloyl-ACP methyl ester carboxylesterase
MKNALVRFFVASTLFQTQTKALLLWLALLVAVAPHSWAKEFNFDSDGVKIHYLVEGKGEPVILIHGLLVNAKLNWEWPGIIAELAKNHRVIALDCRGHGLSDKPTGEDQYGVKMVDDVVRLMDHLDIKNADVVGYSMGGMITMKLMVLHPERVRSAVLGGMGWMEDGRNLFPGVKEGKPQNATEACILGFKGLAVSAKDVQGIKTPFIVIVGDNDPLRQKFVEPLQKLRPDVPVEIVQGADHLSCVNQLQFKEDIKGFLNNPPMKVPPSY